MKKDFANFGVRLWSLSHPQILHWKCQTIFWKSSSLEQCQKFRTISKRYYRLIQTIEVPTREPVTECPTTWLTFKARVKESIITSIDGKARAFFAPQSNVCFSSQNIVWGNALKKLTHKSKIKTKKFINSKVHLFLKSNLHIVFEAIYSPKIQNNI